MKTELFIARRLRLAPGDGGRRSPAVGIAVGGVALAVVVMMVSMAVVLGFQNAIRQKVMGFEASIALKPLPGYTDPALNMVDFTPALREAVAGAVPQASVSMALSQPGILKTPEDFAGVVLNAYGPGHDNSFELSNMIEGKLPSETNDLLVSADIARKLGLKTGDRTDACFFVDNTLKLRRLTVCGIYSSNFSDYDRLTAYVSLPLLQRLRGLRDSQADKIEIRGIPVERIPDATLSLHSALSPLYASGELVEPIVLTDVFQSGAAYFNWLALLDANVIVILIIMSLVSGFTLVSCVFILILQRVRMIGILKSLGARNGQIRGIFMLLGGRVVGLGLLIGNIVGLALIGIQWKWHLLALDPKAYFLTYVPVELTAGQLIALNAGAVLLAALLMLLPAALISRISPAKTMHFE